MYKASTSATGSGSANFTWPTTAIHDRAYILVSGDGNGHAFTSPTGFTLIQQASITGPDTQDIFLFEKKDCTGLENGTLILNSSNGSMGETYAVLAIWSGRDNTADVTFRRFTGNTSANSTPISMPAITTSAATGAGSATGTALAGDDLVAWFATDQNSGGDVWTFNPPSGWTEREDGRTANWTAAELSTLDNVGAGVVGTITGTAIRSSGSGGAGWGAFIFSIPAAPGGGGGSDVSIPTYFGYYTA